MARKFIVEADGASRGNPGPASYGALVADADTGEVLAELAEGIGVETNNVAEYRGLVAGLRAAHGLDPSGEVEVRMDSKLAVQQMSGVWQIKHPAIRPLAVEAREAFPASRVTYTWVPRERNKRADALANLALDKPEEAAERRADAERMIAAVRAAAESGAGAGVGAASGSADAGAEGESRRAVAGGGERSAPQLKFVSDEGLFAAPEPGGLAAASVTRAADSSSDSSAAVGDEASARRTAPLVWSAAPDTGPPTTLIFLRHGATPLTAEKRFSGVGDPDLADTGRAQASAVARRLAARGGVDAVVSSPLRRTRQTAEAAAAALGLTVDIEPDLRETDFGAWDGHTFAEVRERWPAELDAWLASPETAPPGGESFEDVTERVLAARAGLLARHARRTVLVVSHVTPIKTLILDTLRAPLESLYAMELSAASLSVVSYYADGRSSLRLLNDTAHLTG
jgi:probable phosphoglycerate mutase